MNTQKTAVKGILMRSEEVKSRPAVRVRKSQCSAASGKTTSSAPATRWLVPFGASRE